MGMIDIQNDRQLCQIQSFTLSGTTPQATNLVDMQGFSGLTFHVGTGTVTVAGTSGFSFEVQHSDTTAAASFTAVADENLTSLESLLTVTADTADNIPVGSIGYVGTRRYVRLVATGTTNTNAVVMVCPVKGSAAVQPPARTQSPISAT